MLSSGSGKKKEIIIDKESVKKGTSEAKALFKKIANEIIPGVIKQELKTEKYKGEQGLPGKDGTNGKMVCLAKMVLMGSMAKMVKTV